MGSGAHILTVFGTRPEAIELSLLIHALEADPRFDVRVCVSAQHREMLDQVLCLAGIVPDHDLDLMRESQSPDDLTARALTDIGKVLDEERLDWVVVQGDTTTVMAAALAAHYRQISVCDVEAGLRSGDLSQPWPEEANRRIIAAIAGLHCPPTRTSAEALLRENIPSATIHVTGNTVIDALHWVSQRTNAEPSLVSAITELEHRFVGKRIIGLTSHRRENLGPGMAKIAKSVRHIPTRDDIAVISPMHRNSEIRAIMHEQLAGLDNVALIEPLDYLHFTRLLSVCRIVLTDSGGVQEEAHTLGKPVLVMRETTERPEGVSAGTARLVGTCPHRIVRETERLLDDSRAHTAMARAHNPNGDGKSAQRICELLAG